MSPIGLNNVSVYPRTEVSGFLSSWAAKPTNSLLDSLARVSSEYNCALAIAIDELPEMSKYYEEGTLEAFSESYEHTQLNELDHEFYNCSEDLSVLRIAYIRQNPTLFIGD